MAKTSPKSVPTAYQMSLFGSGVSPVRTCLLQEKERDYSENEVDCFLSLLDSYGSEVTINPDGLSLRMLKGFFRLGEDGTLEKFYLNWPQSGMVLNMRFLTRRITAYPKTARECSLSAILQVCTAKKGGFAKQSAEHSERQTKKLLNKFWEARREEEFILQTDSPQLLLPALEDLEQKRDCSL